MSADIIKNCAQRMNSAMDALRREPAVRVDSVERGRALVADTNYPAPDLLQQLADLFVEDSRRNK